MGNSIGGKKRKTAKVMKIDGSSFRCKPPVRAGDVLREHPGCDLLEAEEVKSLGLRAHPLHPEQQLAPGKLYFLVELPRFRDQKGPPRRAWSGALHVSAKDRLESLKLSRRSVSDLSLPSSSSSSYGGGSMRAEVEESDGGVRVKMRLPKAEVTRLVQGSKDAAEAAERIMNLCLEREHARPALAPAPAPVKTMKEKRTRFLPMPEEIIA